MKVLGVVMLGIFGFSDSLMADPEEASGSPQPELWIQSQADWDLHTRLHIARVVALGVKLHSLFPERYGRLSPKLVTAFLQQHDRTKVDRSKDYLEHRGLHQRHESVGASLYRVFYHRDPRGLNPEEIRERENVRDLLNHVDRRNLSDFFLRHGVVPEEQELLKEIEKIADLVDRNKSPQTTEEFGEVLPLHLFMNDCDCLHRARRLREVYAQTTRGLDYAFAKRTLKLATRKPCGDSVRKAQ